MEVPVYKQGVEIGRLQAEGERQTILFTARLRADPGLYRLTVRGSGGTLLLGVLEGPDPMLCRRLSRQLVQPVLPLTCGLLESCCPQPQRQCQAQWQILPREEGMPEGTLWRPRGEGRELALPLPPDGSFPLTELFCFARVQQMQGRSWAVYRFDAAGRPVME